MNVATHIEAGASKASSADTAAGVGDRLDRFISAKGWTARKAAEVLQTSNPMVTYYRRGEKLPGMPQLRALHSATGVDFNWLLAGRRSRPSGPRTLIEKVAAAPNAGAALPASLLSLVADAISFAPREHERALLDLLSTDDRQRTVWLRLLQQGELNRKNAEVAYMEGLAGRFRRVRDILGFAVGSPIRLSGLALVVPNDLWNEWELGLEPRTSSLLGFVTRLDLDLNWLVVGGAEHVVRWSEAP